MLIHFTQGTDFVRIQYEWMDIDRRMPLSNPLTSDPKRVTIKGHPALGASAAWYEGETLVVDTIDFAPGYISTIAERAGLPQSRRMHMVERLSRSGEVLVIETTHLDSANYRTPVVSTIRTMKRAGFPTDRFVVGDPLTVIGAAGRRDRAVLLREVVLKDGTHLTPDMRPRTPSREVSGG